MTRSLILAAFAAAVVVQGPQNVGPGLIGWLSGLTRTDAMLLGLAMMLGILIVTIGTLFVQLLAQNGRLMLRIDALEARLGAPGAVEEPVAGLAVGSKAPAFTLHDVDGESVSLDAHQEGQPTLLLFIEPGCFACEALLPDAARWQRDHAERLRIVPVSRGDHEINRTKTTRYGLQQTLIQADREVAVAYQVQVTPSAVLVREGLISSPLAVGPDAIRGLMLTTTLPAPLKRGDQVPAIKLVDLDATTVELTTRGRPTVLLFWDPGCGFCTAILNELKSWERTRSKHEPRLVLISTGDINANREHQFRSRVCLDPSSSVSRVFGVNGTPSAVMLDEHGCVATDVGAGGRAVLEMLGVTAARNAVPA